MMCLTPTPDTTQFGMFGFVKSLNCSIRVSHWHWRNSEDICGWLWMCDAGMHWDRQSEENWLCCVLLFFLAGYRRLTLALMSCCCLSTAARRSWGRDCWKPSPMPKGLACSEPLLQTHCKQTPTQKAHQTLPCPSFIRHNLKGDKRQNRVCFKAKQVNNDRGEMVPIKRSSSPSTVPASSHISQCKHRDLMIKVPTPHIHIMLMCCSLPFLCLYVQRGSFHYYLF